MITSKHRNHGKASWRRKILRTRQLIDRRASIKAEREDHQWWAEHYEEDMKRMMEFIEEQSIKTGVKS
jgi:hypothetical protein